MKNEQFNSLTGESGGVTVTLRGHIGRGEQFMLCGCPDGFRHIFSRARSALVVFSLAIVVFAGVSGLAQAAERRVAFVIGNSEYQSVPKLPNPKNDAEAVAKALKRSGFEVVTAVNLDRAQFDAAFEKFVRSLQQADVSLFYYSGHGIQVGGDNRIIPTDARLTSAADLEVETISVETIMSYMQKNSKVQLVYLNSCRNNPFPSQSFLVGPEKQLAAAGIGLAPQNSSLGSLVAFSTQPGAVAVDGIGDKSPFTESVLKQSFKLGVDVQAALAKVTQEVWEATHEKQKPWASSTLPEPVFLGKTTHPDSSRASKRNGRKFWFEDWFDICAGPNCS